MPIIEQPLVATIKPHYIFFDTLREAYDYANYLNKSYPVLASKVFMDFNIENRDLLSKNQYLKLLGVDRQVKRICKGLASGMWRLECNVINTYFLQFQIYYTRFLPYAVAFIDEDNEDNYWHIGIDPESMKSLYRDYAEGYNYLALGDSGGFEQSRIVAEDVELYSQVHRAAIALLPKEVDYDFNLWYLTCATYVIIQKPQQIKIMISSAIKKRVCQVIERMGLSVPKEF